MKAITEAEKTIPVLGQYEVIVCGGGPAGVSAAIAAGRSGARTLLIELGGCLGGVWTSGLLSYVLDNGGKKGLLDEIRERLKAMDGYLHEPHPTAVGSSYDGSEDFTYDAESMKLLLEEMCEQAGVDVLLHTRVAAVHKQGRSIAAVVTEGYGGRCAYAGKTFVDCTGNGEFAAQAGCGYDTGHPQTGKIQPASMLMVVSGIPEAQTSTLTKQDKRAFLQLLQEAGVESSYKNPTIFRLPHPDLCCIMLNHQYAVPCDSAELITRATIEGRKEVYRAVKALAAMPGWERLRLVTTANHIGLREGRRIHGLYKVTVDDLLNGQTFPDPVCLVKLPVDVHALEPSKEYDSLNQGLSTKPYHIPYRSLIARDLDNLAMAGRCISGDFYAHASYRVTGNSVPLGEAAGIAAALSSRTGARFADIDGSVVTRELEARGYTF
ncbi:MAG: glucose-inhibited division protein [Paenibacillus sp.]|jgi:hypothetical protein|nr:glucose-inhibited division protein [Paenibacillus sp.]